MRASHGQSVRLESPGLFVSTWDASRRCHHCHPLFPFCGNVKMAFFILLLLSLFHMSGSSGVQKESVSVMEGDSVTLNNDKLIIKYKQGRVKWYCNDTRIVQITGDQSQICADDQCKERFRDRLKLDNQTGSLTITDTTTEDSGLYQLQIVSSGNVNEMIFNVTVYGVPELNKVRRKSVKEGESVTLSTSVMKDPNDVMAWYFNKTLIAEITGDQSQICADDQCKARFRDRLKLDQQTGSLTITHTKTSDSGDYKLETCSNSSIGRRHRRSVTKEKSFSVTIIAVPGSGLSSAAVPGIVVGVLLVSAALTAAVIYYHHHRRRTAVPQNSNGVGDSMPLSERDSTGRC